MVAKIKRKYNIIFFRCFIIFMKCIKNGNKT